jgi:hypothetical protein
MSEQALDGIESLALGFRQKVLGWFGPTELIADFECDFEGEAARAKVVIF